MQFRLTNSQR